VPARRSRGWDLTDGGKRIAANNAALGVTAARCFYEAVLWLRVLMDGGWIVTHGVETRAAVQRRVACAGGSGKLINVVAHRP
jgi:hypothetical protein